MRILIVDDDKDLCHLTKMALNKHGHDVSAFQEAEAALEFAKAHNPQLILMDIMLPGMDGADAVRLIKADNQLRNIPVIVLTGLISGNEGKKQVTIDGTQYRALAKPYEIEDLIKVVEANVPKPVEN